MNSSREPRRRYSATGETDMLYNLLFGFIMMFIVSFIFMNPIKENVSPVPPKAVMLVTMTWENDSIDDVDLWIHDPNNMVVGYRSTSVGLMNLQKDDTGALNDTVWVDGEEITIPSNHETVSFRGIVPGEYSVNVHMFSKRTVGLTNVIVKIIRISPFKILHERKLEMIQDGEELTAFRISLDKDGRASDISYLPHKFVINGFSYSGDASSYSGDAR